MEFAAFRLRLFLFLWHFLRKRGESSSFSRREREEREIAENERERGAQLTEKEEKKKGEGLLRASARKRMRDLLGPCSREIFQGFKRGRARTYVLSHVRMKAAHFPSLLSLKNAGKCSRSGMPRSFWLKEPN